MNAGSVDKACKSNVLRSLLHKELRSLKAIKRLHFVAHRVVMSEESGKLVSNTWGTSLRLANNSEKSGLIRDSPLPPCGVGVKNFGRRRSCVLSASWWGNGLPRRRRVGGVRAWPPTLGLRHCPDTYGWLQSRIFGNARKCDRATLRVGRRPSGCKLLSWGKNF
jgi:hypothetical protein